VINKNDYISRRKKLVDQLKKGSVLLMFSGSELTKSADEKYPFFGDRNFLYLTGITQHNSALLIVKTEVINETLYVLPKNEIIERRAGRRLSEKEINEASGISNIHNIDTLEKDLIPLIMDNNCNKLYLNQDFQTLQLKETEVVNLINKKLSKIDIENIYPKIAGMRRYKSQNEIQAIRNAINLTKKGIIRGMKFCKPNVMEYQIEAEYLHEAQMAGHRVQSFSPIVAAGKQIFYLHYASPMAQVMDGDLVLMDVGVGYNHYCSDVSRVFPSNGKFTKKQTEIYNIALEASRSIMEEVRPGRNFSITNEICKKVAFKELKKLGIISDFSDIEKYVWHKTTHHVGLDTHDVGGYDDPMAENMIFTVDAGIYIREWGIGLRVEDDVLVTKNGCENLSRAIPSEIKDIEMLLS
jgi:Xaa-Pro aminopeptidase